MVTLFNGPMIIAYKHSATKKTFVIRTEVIFICQGNYLTIFSFQSLVLKIRWIHLSHYIIEQHFQ